MLLNGGELDGRRLLAPRTVEMMHTNHMSAEATANMRPGMSFGMDFMIYDDPAAAGEPHAPGRTTGSASTARGSGSTRRSIWRSSGCFSTRGARRPRRTDCRGTGSTRRSSTERSITNPAAAGERPGAYYWLGIDGTWFWIDPALDLAFVGMLQHQGRAQAEAHGLSRNWVYQAIVD